MPVMKLEPSSQELKTGESFSIVASLPRSVYDELIAKKDDSSANDDSYDSNQSDSVGDTEEEWVKLDSSACEYSSSNPEVASVSSDGIVEAKQAGQAEITVTLQEDTEELAICTVTVSDAPEATNSPLPSATPSNGVLTLEESSKTIKLGDTYHITATYGDTSETASYSYVSMGDCTYSGYDSSVVSVSGGNVSAVGFGTTEITVSYSGCSAVCKVTVLKPKEYKMKGSVKLKPGRAYSFAPYFVYSDGSKQSMTSESAYQVGNAKLLSQNGSKVTAKKGTGGKTTVTASCMGFQAKCTVTLVKLTASAKKKSVKVAVGRKYKLINNVKSNASASFLNSAFKWKVSKKKMVSVSKGVLRAKKSGSCKVSGYVSGKKKISYKIIIP